MKLAKRIVQLASVIFICVYSISCFAIDTTNITKQNNVKGVSEWYSNLEFHYFTENKEWFLYNISSNTYQKTTIVSEPEWTGNQNIKAKFSDDARTLLIRNEKDKSIKKIKLDQEFNTGILSISNSGKYIGLCLAGPMEDENKWIIFNSKSLEFITVPLDQEEYSFGTIAWSSDDKYITIDIAKIKEVNMEYDEICNSGVLIYDIENKKLVKKYVKSSSSFWCVVGLKYPQVLFLNEKDQLCLYNVTTNTQSVIYEGKIDNALWGPNKEIYTVLNKKLVRITY